MLSNDEPYALKSPEEQVRRRGMLTAAHIAPLDAWVRTIADRAGVPQASVATVDPCDGGVNACALFLFAAPGGGAPESGFISRNNPDSSAKYVGELLAEAGIERRSTLLWNAVPWCLDSKQCSKDVLISAGPYLEELLRLLPDLRVVVLLGGIAQRLPEAVPGIFGRRMIVTTWLPSVLAFNPKPERRDDVLRAFRAVALLCQGMPSGSE